MSLSGSSLPPQYIEKHLIATPVLYILYCQIPANTQLYDDQKIKERCEKERERVCQGVPLGKQMELVGVFCVEDLAGVASCWLSFNKDSSPPPPPPKTDTHQQKEKQMGKGRMRETKEMFHKFASLKPGRDTNNSYLVYTHSHSCHGTPYTQTFCTNNSQILS